MRVAIIGAGSMGSWFAELVDGWLEPIIVDVNEQRAIELATHVGCDHATIGDLESVPVICTAVPIPATVDVLEQVAPISTTAVIDLSGTMTAPIATMREHSPSCERISIHALFAPDNEPGNVAAVIEEPNVVWETLRTRLESRDNRVFKTDARTHDQAMETVQAKVHAAIIAYALAADPVDDRFHTPISAELADLAEAVLSGSARVYADIQEAFDGADDLARAANDLAEADPDRFEALYREARTIDRSHTPE